jgi:cyclophilin family peptidyl-prolyl cis-trans isomerase
MILPSTRAHRPPVLMAAVLGMALLAASCTGGASPTPIGQPDPSVSAPPSARPSGCPTAQPAALPAGETRTVTIDTSLGTIGATIEGALSPIAAGNFVALAECGYYDGVVFHRVVPGFVIQGGDPTGTGRGGPGYTIADEPVTATYRRGTLAMARTPAPNSQGSQFFIVLDDAAAARGLATANTYAIFGSVTIGMEVVDAIAAAADAELPTQPIAMTSVSVTNP